MDCCEDTEGLGLPGTYNIRARLAGDTWPGLSFTITVNEVPVDFTGCTVDMAFKRRSRLGKLEWLLSSETGAITVDDNIITVTPRLLTLKPDSYVYDLQVTFSDGTVRTYVKGSFQVLSDITA